MSKFRYPIFPDRTYTLEYDGYSGEVLGQDILNMFRRSIHLDKIIEELYKDSDLPRDPNTPENDKSYPQN
jgi:hypothetical protein